MGSHIQETGTMTAICFNLTRWIPGQSEIPGEIVELAAAVLESAHGGDFPCGFRVYAFGHDLKVEMKGVPHPTGLYDARVIQLVCEAATAVFKEGHRRGLYRPAGAIDFFTIDMEKRAEELRVLTFPGVVGPNRTMHSILDNVSRVAKTDSTVLIEGENGTGKELIAQAVHFNGPRKNGPFVTVNCGAIPKQTIESELFGHVRGAFTDAVFDHKGYFEQADSGTIFLDEVGELPVDLQVKLLRVLQEKTIMPVGGEKQLRVNVRVISATNKDLRIEMAEGHFREDLYFRLKVVPIKLPPLRERIEEIPGLVAGFIDKLSREVKKQFRVTPEYIDALKEYPWDGNIRQLGNFVERSVVLDKDNVLDIQDLPPEEEEPRVLPPDPREVTYWMGDYLSLDWRKLQDDPAGGVRSITTVTVLKKGQTIIQKAIRDRHGIAPGTKLKVIELENCIVLIPPGQKKRDRQAA